MSAPSENRHPAESGRQRRRHGAQGELLISAQATRSQASNLSDAIGRLQSALDEAAEAIRPIVSDPAKVKALKKRQAKVRARAVLSRILATTAQMSGSCRSEMAAGCGLDGARRALIAVARTRVQAHKVRLDSKKKHSDKKKDRRKVGKADW